MYSNLPCAKHCGNWEEEAPAFKEFEWQRGNRAYTNEQIDTQSAMKKFKIYYLNAEWPEMVILVREVTHEQIRMTERS